MKDYDRRVRFAPISQVGDTIFLSRPLFFHLTAKSSAFGGYEILLLRKQGLYKVISAKKQHYKSYRTDKKTQFASTGKPIVPIQGAITTMTRPTRMNTPAKKISVLTGKPTTVEAPMTTPMSSKNIVRHIGFGPTSKMR